MMTGRENIKRAVTFGSPAYLPVYFSVNCDWLQEKNKVKLARIKELQSLFPKNRLSGLDYWPPRQEEPGNGIRRWKDYWGVGWMDDGHGARTCSHPLEEGYHLMDDYLFPDPDGQGTFSEADEKLVDREDKYVIGQVWFTLFERLWMLRGFQNMLADPYLEEENFSLLRDRILAFNLRILDRWLQRRVDAIYFSDDWGSQRGLLMNPEDWRRHYKPAYAAMFKKVRDAGVHVWMHLCGDVTAILPDLVECGLHVLNPIQPQAMDTEELSRLYGGAVAFHGGVDVQGTMVNGSPQDVKAEVRRLVTLFGSFKGGYIGGTSHSVMPETPLDNVIALYESFLEYQ